MTRPRFADPQPLIGHWIGGGERLPEGAGRIDVYDPAYGTTARQAVKGDAIAVAQAVAAAVKAQPAWAETPASKRARVMFAMRELTERYADDLARLITREHGKTLADAKGEVQRGLEVIEFACGAPQLLKGQFSENVGGGVAQWSFRAPVGVAAGITPFNFPFMAPMWMIPPALVCGNGFVLKPSERDPSASLMAAELFLQAGLPEGLFNVVQGEKEAAEALIAHPDVAAVSFVGSTPAARAVYEAAAKAGKRAQALGGAKNHMIVAPDADTDRAADAIAGAAFGSAGQRCMAISVAVAVGAAADKLAAALKARAAALRVQDGESEGAEMGPLITPQAKARAEALVASGVEEGAELLHDGRGLKVPGREGGFFMGPCVFDHVRPSMRIYREEIFAPVLCIMRAETLQEAADLVNGSPYGNGAVIWTRDIGAAHAFASHIRAGMIGINVPLPVPAPWHSFGGWKQSLFGDAHMYGEEGIRFFTRYKSVMQRAHEGAASCRVDFGMPVNR